MILGQKEVAFQSTVRWKIFKASFRSSFLIEASVFPNIIFRTGRFFSENLLRPKFSHDHQTLPVGVAPRWLASLSESRLSDRALVRVEKYISLKKGDFEKKNSRKKLRMGRNDGLNERLLESENNRLSDQLAGKISKLKAISIEMKVSYFSLIYFY